MNKWIAITITIITINNNSNNNNDNNNNNVSAKYRMCGESDETISHIVLECKKLAKWQKNKVECEKPFV